MKRVKLLKIENDDVIVEDHAGSITIVSHDNSKGSFNESSRILPISTSTEHVRIQTFRFKDEDYYYAIPREVEFIVNFKLSEQLKSEFTKNVELQSHIDEAELTIENFWGYPLWKRLYLATIKSF